MPGNHSYLDTWGLVKKLAFGDSHGAFLQVKKVLSANVTAEGVERLDFWHAIDLKDFSSLRSFVIPFPSDSVFEVDFLSRHELMPPMTPDGLPPGWEKWADLRGSQLIITDKAGFCSRMLTADAFVALPTYRFGLFADDVACVMADAPVAIEDAAWKALTSPLTGYSFTQYQRGTDGPVIARGFSIATPSFPMPVPLYNLKNGGQA